LEALVRRTPLPETNAALPESVATGEALPVVTGVLIPSQYTSAWPMSPVVMVERPTFPDVSRASTPE